MEGKPPIMTSVDINDNALHRACLWFRPNCWKGPILRFDSIRRNLFLCLNSNLRLDLRAFQLSVVNLKPKQEELPIRIKETIAKRSQWVLEAKTSKVPEERENASHQVKIGVCFVSDWSRGWREWSLPTAERGKAKPKVILNVFRLSIENCSVARPSSLIC